LVFPNDSSQSHPTESSTLDFRVMLFQAQANESHSKNSSFEHTMTTVGENAVTLSSTGFANLNVTVVPDLDIFSTSTLAQQHGTSVTGDLNSTQHDIHTASLSLLSVASSARGLTRAKDNDLLSILSKSLTEVTKKHDDQNLSLISGDENKPLSFTDVTPTEQLGNAQRVFKHIQNKSTTMLSLPIWYFNQSLSRSFTPSSLHVTLPNILLSILHPITPTAFNSSALSTPTSTTATATPVNPLSRRLADSISSLSIECDESIHETFSSIRKMRVRASTSTQRDVPRPQIDKLRGMIEHLFVMVSNTSSTLGSIAPMVHHLIKWTSSLELLHHSLPSTLGISSTSVHPFKQLTKAPCTLSQLYHLTHSLFEIAQGELLLLQRVTRTLDQVNFPTIHKEYNPRCAV